MRTKNSIRNAIVSVIMVILTSLIGLISQKIFITILCTEYLGITGLFTNIISMLGIVELGIGPAIIYNLYRPVKENDINKIKSLVFFYKKAYTIIAFLVLLIWLLFIPFLPFIVNNVTISDNIIVIYILFLVDTFASYLIAYKQSILYANQENYIVNIIHIFYLVIMNILQLIFLYITHNYYLYLIIKIMCRFGENYVVAFISKKKYPEIFVDGHEKLDKKTSKGIFKRTKGLVFHKLGNFVVDGSDIIIISFFLGIKMVGLYTNYNLIITAINNLMTHIFSAITASVGNLLIEPNKEKKYCVFENIYFINFWISSIISIAFLCVIQPFIVIWIGEEYLLSTMIIITLSMSLYVRSMTKTMNTFKEAAGIFYEDRLVPVGQSIINIVLSIILVHYFGMAGVFMGTIISYLLLHFYSYPKYVYKTIFSDSILLYFIHFFKYLLLVILMGVISFIIIEYINFNNSLIQIFFNGIISLIIVNIVIFVFFHNSREYKYCLHLLKNMLKKLKVVKS